MKRLGRRFLPVLFVSAIGIPATGADEGTTPPRLDRSEVSAAGRHAALLTVGRFGRYAVTAKSAQGTALQLVDRMAGPGSIAGTAGETDGRLDAFLERGEYRVLTDGHRRATGNVRLDVRAFTERNAPEPPVLIEHKTVLATLEDFSQLSYWLQITERRTVALEAAGRDLADLRLWKDGGWLVDLPPTVSLATPRTGQPLRVLRLAVDLEPGLYLLTAYGGPPLPWSEEGGHPFHLRFGIPTLPEASRRRLTVSPFGTDRYVVPGAATYFRVELPEARPASMQVGWFDADRPFALDGPVAEVTKKSVPPVAELSVDRDPDQRHVVTVSGTAGQTYILQHFENSARYTFAASGDYWISTVHSGHAADSVDATGVLVATSASRNVAPPAHVEPRMSQTIPLDTRTGWARRANLLGTLTVFLDVREAGTYEVLAEGTDAELRMEPFLIDVPRGYEAPAFRGPGSTWNLDRGLHVLTANPKRRGIVTIGVRPRGLLTPLQDLLGSTAPPEIRPVRASVRFPSAALDAESSYTLFLNTQPQVNAGVILRPLPLDLTAPLFVSQRPEDAVSVPFRADEAGRLRAEAEDGSTLEIALDGGAWQRAIDVPRGNHSVAVRNTTPQTVDYSLVLEPRRLSAEAALPALPPEAKDGLPDFPVLTDAAARHFDLERAANATFLVRADKPGLYRLESSGLLATEGNLRSRTVPSFVREGQNGIGRNFLLQQYLREGDYQVTVAAQGSSAGHLGIGLTRTPIENGGFLTSRRPARATLASGGAVSYRFTITRPGTFRVRSIGLGRSFRCRLEDANGWPVVPPNGLADVTRYFEPGRYRLVVLPEAVDARVVTVIEPVSTPRALKGHGPHPLPLGQPRPHVWMEPAEGEERHPDVWTVNVPAPIAATIELTGVMEGRLVPENGQGTVALPVHALKGYKGAILAGRYRLEVVSARRNNRAPYTVTVWPDELVAGLTREVTAPITLDVSVGDPGFVDLTSFGGTDVRARLTDSDGRVVGSSDDRSDDWNFHVGAALEAGRYRLQIDPVGATQATTEVSMRIAEAVAKPALALPVAADIALGQKAHVYPLATVDSGVLLVSARSAESVGLSLEVAVGDAWQSLATSTGRLARLEVPVATETLRLRLWSLDRRDSPVRLTVVLAKPTRVSEADLARGVALVPVAGSAPKVGVVEVRLENPGLFDFPGGGLRVSVGSHQAARETAGIVAATSRTLWLIGESHDAGSAPARAARRSLAPGDTAVVALPPSTPVRGDVSTAGKDDVLLARAAQRTGQPGVRWLARNAAVEASGAQMATGDGSAAAASLDGGSAVGVWSASRSVADTEVKLDVRRFPRPAVERARAGVLDGRIAGGAARAFDLPSGPKQMRLTLGDGVIGVLSKGSAVESVHWIGGASFDEALETGADRLTLLGTTPAESPFAVETIPLDRDGQARVALGAPYEGRHVRAGQVRLSVPAAAEGRLHVRGSRGPATVVCAGGDVRRGIDIELAGCEGTLVAPHGPGLLLAWIDRPGGEAQDLWAQTSAPAVVSVTPPASVPIDGSAASLRFRPQAPAMLHVRAPIASVTLLTRGDGPPEVTVHPVGTVLDVYLPGGAADLRMRAVAGSSLSGRVEVTTTEVTPIEEGLGPEVVLAPGDTRLFSFVAKREGPVGIGVRAGSDVVEATLLSSDGKRLGAGTVQMPSLVPGTYLLSLHAPEDGVPVRARPAVAGLVLPSVAPPEDIVRSYLQPDDAPPSFTSTRVVAPPYGRRTGYPAEEPVAEGDESGMNEEEGDGDERMEPGIAEDEASEEEAEREETP